MTEAGVRAAQCADEQSGARPLADSAPPSHGALREGSALVKGRLHVQHRLGQGGMGVVYRAFDQERRCNVALKTLNQLDAAGIYQLKNEFRALANVRHPSLVHLHELFFDRDLWFFTMDLVEGVHFDRWVRPEGKLDEARLRSSLCQLVDALDAIHMSGKLHRDVKPSNVLVEANGRLIVLDFGLVIDPTAGTVGQTLTDLEVTGTPDYMAPEQAAGRQTSEATDYYAVGVMLFEALSGKRPFEGSLGEILAAKQRDQPPRPFGENLAADLETLCVELLARDPSARPDGREIRARVADEAVPRASQVRAMRCEEQRVQLLGRDAELGRLREAYAAACDGTPVLVAVSGESGMGKTALCQAFLQEVRDAGHAVVLSGRCYEHENVPFKLLDPLIDELSRYLRRLRAEQSAALLPRDAFALAQLFPVLMRVRAFEEAPAREVPEPRELQRLAFNAFGELLGRIRDRQPLVLYVDDLQWTDADSAKFVRHLLILRAPVAVLFVACHRSEDSQRNPLVKLVMDAARSNRRLDVRQIALHPLAPLDTAALAQRLLGQAGDAQTAGSAIASESRGNPFFAMELARFASANHDPHPTPSLASVIAARVAALPQSARTLLQALALAGQPLPIEVLLHAGSSHADVDELAECHLLRGSELGGSKLIECYHDRVRESVQASLSAEERTARYRELARALARRDEPELLSRCLEGVGELERAAQHAALAAERATTALAFERAAELYRRALRLHPSAPNRLETLERLGRALENAGRGPEAAATYLEAASLAHSEASLDLQRRAAEQLMTSGRLEQGTALLREVCGALDLHLPTSAGAALVSMGLSQLKLRLRSLDRLCEPPFGAVNLAPGASLRLRSLRSAVTGFIGYLPVHAAAVAALYLRDAYDSPDLVERARASGFHSHLQCMIDPHSRYAAALLVQLDRLVAIDGRPELIGFAHLMHGSAAYCREQYREARGQFERGRQALRGGTGVEWELDSTNIYDQLSALYCGDYADITRMTPPLLDEAQRRGRTWTLAMLSGFAGMPAWLGSGDVDGYRARVREARAVWHSPGAAAWPDYMLLMADALLAVYLGEPERGFEQFEVSYDAFRRSLIGRKANIAAVGYATHRATCAASALARTRGSERALRRLSAALHDSIGTLQRRGGTKAQAMAALFGAALEFNIGAPDRAVQGLRGALAQLEQAGAGMHLAAARRRLGTCLGGDEGAQLIAAGDDFMRAQGVLDTEPMTELTCPGFRR